MKVLFFACRYEDVLALVKNNPGNEYLAIVNSAHKFADGYPENSELNVLTVNLRDSEDDEKIITELQSADCIIYHRESTLLYLVKFYEKISEVAKSRLPSKQALEISSDKILMRQAYLDNYPEITPKYIKVDCSDNDFLDSLSFDHLEFPVIIKPSNSSTSVFVQKFNNESDLIAGITKTCSQVSRNYQRIKKESAPELIVEEFVEGDMYTVGSWVDSEGVSTHAPLVRVMTANDIGKNGFYLFSRKTIDGDAEMQKSAEEICEKAIKAAGLTNSSAHCELLLTKNGWKIIEVGARVGGYRQWMYMTSYGFDSYQNDLNVKIGEPIDVDDSLITHSAALHLSPDAEGYISKINGIDKIKELKSYKSHTVNIHEGDKVFSSTNGGTAVMDVLLSNDDSAILDQDIEGADKLFDVEFKR